MTNQKPCIRCQRSIDEQARICPFCNWDQSEPVPPRDEMPAAPVYVPPSQRPWHGGLVAIAAFVALIIVAFVIGTFIHGFEPNEVKAAQMKNNAPASTTPPHRSNVTLVPVTGSEPAPIEQPITTAPPQAPGQQPNDATALPADQYAAASARAKAQRQAEEKTKSAMIDPRALTGNVYEPSLRPVTPRPRVSASETQAASQQTLEGPPPSAPVRTSAFLEYKPLPHIAVDHDITARLNLTVDPDGRVTDIDVSEPVPDMSKVIAAVQNWRFKPATENGSPVTAHVSVDITFRANE